MRTHIIRILNKAADEIVAIIHERLFAGIDPTNPAELDAVKPRKAKAPEEFRPKRKYTRKAKAPPEGEAAPAA